MLDEFWAVIPARSGSIKLKNKNILKINNRPLIHYTQEVATKTVEINKIIFTSDSLKYIQISKKKFPADIYHIRPKNISGKNSKDITFFKSILKMLNEKKYEIPKYFVHLRPTCPIRDPKIISKAIKIFKKLKNFSSLRSVSQSSETAFKSFIIRKSRLANVFTNSFNLDNSNFPRHMYPQTYDPNSYVDIVKTTNIGKGILHGKRVYPYIIKDFVMDINTKLDFERAENLIKKKKYRIKVYDYKP